MLSMSNFIRGYVMDANNYLNLLPPCRDFEESAVSYSFLRERHLQAMWLEQKYFRPLSTSDGTPITVISPGIWNAEAGPDFLKAHLRIGDRNLRGDIEIHLNDEGWYQHNHHLDEKYNQVILHVSYWKPKHSKSIFSSEGKEFPRTYIEEQLTIPESRILKLIDLDLYPYKHFVGSGTCAGSLFRSMPEHKIVHFFHSAAEWRLIQKREFLRNRILETKDLIAAGLAMALGYKHNAEAFLKLFLHLKVKKIDNEHDLLAYSLGICNFFHQKYQEKWSKSTYYNDLSSRFHSMAKENHPIFHLVIDKIRPANHPVRRIATLAKIVSDPSVDTLFEQLNSIWKNHWPEWQDNGKRSLLNKFLEVLPNYTDHYWERHYTFEEFEQPNSIVLVSNDFKKEALINIYLPLLHHEIVQNNDTLEKKALHSFYSTLLAPKTKKGTYLAHRFFGDTQKTNLLSKAAVQQGAYQLHKDFCIHFEASCLGCPFVERYNAIFTRS